MDSDEEEDDNILNYGEEDEDDVELGSNLKMAKFIMKNGCCRDCMKAFSKSGKVSIFCLRLIYDSRVSVKFHVRREEQLSQ